MDIMDFNTTIRELLIHNPHAQLIISANVGTTMLGAIDNIPEIKLSLDQIIKETEACTHYTIHADAAIPVSLICNELLTNAYKYAFTHDKANKLLVELLIENLHNKIVNCIIIEKLYCFLCLSFVCICYYYFT
jgi:glutamate/tyrosine decarboxylase-like PLP-dependent enzyme